MEPSYLVGLANTVITGATALVGRELTVHHNASIAIADGRIAEIAIGDDLASDNAERVQAQGMSLLPGFIDAHVHIGFYDPAEVLRGGVTSVRDLGWPPDVIFPLARRSRDPDFEGPYICAAGPMLTAPGGYPSRAAWAPSGTGLEVADEEAARAAVAETAQQGAVIVKIALDPSAGPTLDPDVLGAIVAAAHELDLTVTGHIYGLDQLELAIDAGIDELAHMLMSPDEIPDRTIDRMVARGIVVVPTLSIRAGSDLEIAIDNVARFLRAGGRVVYGTDLGNAGPRPGIDPLEIDGMTAAGMNPRAIVAAATINAADHVGLDTGVIEVGMPADLALVEGDAEKDAGALTRVVKVWRGGRLAA